MLCAWGRCGRYSCGMMWRRDCKGRIRWRGMGMAGLYALRLQERARGRGCAGPFFFCKGRGLKKLNQSECIYSIRL